MCLCVIEKRFKPNNKIREAYKVFLPDENDSSKLRFTYQLDHSEVKIGVWLHAEGDEIIVMDPPPGCSDVNNWREKATKLRYPAGFHAYDNLKDARKAAYGGIYPIRLVLLKDTRTVGREYLDSTAHPPTEGVLFVAKHLLVTNQSF